MFNAYSSAGTQKAKNKGKTAEVIAKRLLTIHNSQFSTRYSPITHNSHLTSHISQIFTFRPITLAHEKITSLHRFTGCS